MKLQKKIVKVLQAEGWDIDSEPYKQDGYHCVEINHATPAGEDWHETIWYDGTPRGFINGVFECYYDFDVDDDVELWVAHRGQNGVPRSIKTLVENAEYKEETLRQLYNKLCEVIK